MRAPDSDFIDGIGDDRKIEVAWTDPVDFPSSGAVTIRMYWNAGQSSTLKITKAEAREALLQLVDLLASEQPGIEE